MKEIKDIMIKNPITIADNATVQDAIDLFSYYRIGCLPVVDPAGHLVSFLSDGDGRRLHLPPHPPAGPHSADFPRHHPSPPTTTTSATKTSSKSSRPLTSCTAPPKSPVRLRRRQPRRNRRPHGQPPSQARSRRRPRDQQTHRAPRPPRHHPRLLRPGHKQITTQNGRPPHPQRTCHSHFYHLLFIIPSQPDPPHSSRRPCQGSSVSARLRRNRGAKSCCQS